MGNKDCKKCLHYPACMINSEYVPTPCRVYEDKDVYRKQIDGEWEMFNLITSTYYGKQYYFLNKDGSVYSRDSHTNMSRDEAVNEFLDVFRQ